YFLFVFSGRRRHTRCYLDWSSVVCSSDLDLSATLARHAGHVAMKPGGTERVLHGEPAWRKDHEVDRIDAGRIADRLQHEKDRRVDRKSVGEGRMGKVERRRTAMKDSGNES